MQATFVTLWLQVVQPLANVQETKWMLHVKRETDVAQSYTSSAIMMLYCKVLTSGECIGTTVFDYLDTSLLIQ